MTVRPRPALRLVALPAVELRTALDRLRDAVGPYAIEYASGWDEGPTRFDDIDTLPEALSTLRTLDDLDMGLELTLEGAAGVLARGVGLDGVLDLLRAGSPALDFLFLPLFADKGA